MISNKAIAETYAISEADRIVGYQSYGKEWNDAYDRAYKKKMEDLNKDNE